MEQKNKSLLSSSLKVIDINNFEYTHTYCTDIVEKYKYTYKFKRFGKKINIHGHIKLHLDKPCFLDTTTKRNAILPHSAHWKPKGQK